MLTIGSVLAIPALIGCFLVLIKSKAIFRLTEVFYGWLNRKSQHILSSKSLISKIAKYTVEPLYSVFIAINDWTVDIKDIGVKSGIRIGAYLYLTGFLLFVFISIGNFLIILALIAAGILLAVILPRYLSEVSKEKKPKKTQAWQSEEQTQTFVERIWLHFRKKTTKEKVEELFGCQKIEVDMKGNIYSNDLSQFSEKTKIGLVDKNGGIYDTRQEMPEKIGRIDAQGNIIEQR
jgi:hypothetical protein